ADQPTGRVIYVPNARVFTVPQTNYHRGLPYIFDDIVANISFESDSRKARQILAETGRRHALPDPAGADAQTPAAHTGRSPRERGVRLMMRYMVDARQRTPTQSAIWEDVLRAFAAHDDIRFAYRTFRRVEREPSLPPLDGVPRAGSEHSLASTVGGTSSRDK